MEWSGIITFFLSSLLRELPQFIVLFGGLFYCFTKWESSAKASRTAFIGIIILILVNLLGLVMSVVQIQLTHWIKDSFERVAFISFTIGFVLNVISAIGLSLILYAVWIGRDEKKYEQL